MTKTKTTILAMIVVAVTAGLLTSTLSFSNAVDAQSTAAVPSWIQNVAGFWSNGDIPDDEFVNAMTFLVQEGIMDLPNVVSPAEAQTITSSLEDMNDRLEKIEKQTTEGTTIAPTPAIPEEPPEDTTYEYVFAVCPSNKIRHFDKVLYKFTPTSEVFLGNVRLACSNGDWVYEDELGVMILEEKHSEINQQINIKNRLMDKLKENDCRMDEEGDANISGPQPLPWDIELIEIDYAVICANKPGVSESGDDLGYK